MTGENSPTRDIATSAQPERGYEKLRLGRDDDFNRQ
jgi:hypothetical protein